MTDQERFKTLSNFYEHMRQIQSAICVAKGGIPLENYAGRFFAADVLEMMIAAGDKIKAADADTKAKMERYRAEFESVKNLVTPSQKPVFEMTLEEFEKVMNI